MTAQKSKGAAMYSKYLLIRYISPKAYQVLDEFDTLIQADDAFRKGASGDKSDLRIFYRVYNQFNEVVFEKTI